MCLIASGSVLAFALLYTLDVYVPGGPGGRGLGPMGTGPIAGQARFPLARPAASTGEGPLDQLGFGGEPGDQAQRWAEPGGFCGRSHMP